MNPLVSIVLPVYNGEKHLSGAITSALIQTYRNWELIIIDNGSTDQTADIIQQMSEFLGPRMRVIPLAENVGIRSARALGILQSHGELIAFIDHDDLWRSDKLEKQVKCFRSGTVLVYSNQESINADGDVISEGAPFSGRNRGGIFEEHLFHPVIPFSSVIVRKDAAVRAMYAYGDYKRVPDYAFLLEILERGAADFVDEPLISYRVYPESTSNLKKRETVSETVRCCLGHIWLHPVVLLRHPKDAMMFLLREGYLLLK